MSALARKVVRRTARRDRHPGGRFVAQLHPLPWGVEPPRSTASARAWGESRQPQLLVAGEYTRGGGGFLDLVCGDCAEAEALELHEKVAAALRQCFGGTARAVLLPSGGRA